MPDFVHPSLLTIGLPLIALPILIHLINKVRQRRVRWAAMEFLLQSQRRNRTWVLLTQLLLLLLRMGAVAAVVLMVAQPVLRSRLGSLFGGTRTHHVILLDDSFSMSERFAGTSAFEKAIEVIRRLGEQAARQSNLQQFTILRFSKAGQTTRGTQPDMHRRNVDTEFLSDLDALLSPQSLEPSQLATGPADPLDALSGLLAGQADAQENRVVYVLSDFRAKEWDGAPALRDALAEIADGDAQLQLVHCAGTPQQNLTISGLKPKDATRAVGVGIPIEVSVTNHGTQPRSNISVTLEQDGQARPAINFDQVLPGETASRTFEVRFLDPGEHRLMAQLPQDAVSVDNQRFAVIHVPRAVAVLAIDGSRERRNDAFYLTRALAPDAKTPTGIEPVEETPRVLSTKPLNEFQTIYLLNVDRLEDAAVEALEQYVRNGGGLAIFLGPATDVEFVNRRLYRGGEGLFPAPLVAPIELLVDRLATAADLQLTDHPIFARFAGQRNTDINAVTINKYFAVQKSWKPAEDSTAAVIARLRNGAPLALEQKFGDGTVLAFLTTAGPGQWNNWGRDNASYVVTMLELQAYLAAGRQKDLTRQVGAPLKLSLDPGRYAPAVRFVPPASDADAVFVTEAVPSENSEALNASLAETFTSGFYEAQLTGSAGETEPRSFAFNVAPQEGDLRVTNSQRLSELLQGVDYNYAMADDVSFSAQNLAGFHLGTGVLYALIVLLLLEQVTSYLASYHPPSLQGGRS